MGRCAGERHALELFGPCLAFACRMGFDGPTDSFLWIMDAVLLAGPFALVFSWCVALSPNKSFLQTSAKPFPPFELHQKSVCAILFDRRRDHHLPPVAVVAAAAGNPVSLDRQKIESLWNRTRPSSCSCKARATLQNERYFRTTLYPTMMAENEEAPTVANLIIIRRNGKDSSHPRELTVDDEEMLVGR